MLRLNEKLKWSSVNLIVFKNLPGYELNIFEAREYTVAAKKTLIRL